ncbi:hypothetical protein G7K_0319-t1 [Saitoella complicata NRRL Y-17804]|uniref:Uncharacterized protein n=1 Tax=Saitoella complicata (strain BCRC 22490 / CBS 7301 / JCM 7358 / NBRC 10748 / NRRL Y-17804) TaxID=698492 RepID=A0A0E9N8P9_SAICN|nr:hypothetical protein G7K_0319-t1 [Saitoella complicata NRRL Y-17804]
MSIMIYHGSKKNPKTPQTTVNTLSFIIPHSTRASNLVLSNELLTLGDVLLQVSQAGIDELLLVLVDLTQLVDLLNTLRAKLNVGREELASLISEERRLNEGRLDDTLLTSSSPQQSVGHLGTGVGHGEGGGASTVLGLDDLVTTELDTVDELVTGLTRDTVAGLGKEGNDGDTGVTTDNGDLLLGSVGTLDLGDEAVGTDNVEGGDTEKLLGVVDTSLLEDLGNDGDGGVDGVGNDQDLSLGAELSTGLGQIADDGSVGVEEVITSHSGLAGNTSGDNDDLGTGKGLLEAVVLGEEAGNLTVHVAVVDIAVDRNPCNVRSNSGSATDIVERKVGDLLVQAEKEGEGLTDTTGGTEDGNLGGGDGGGGEGALASGRDRTESEHRGYMRVGWRFGIDVRIFGAGRFPVMRPLLRRVKPQG